MANIGYKLGSPCLYRRLVVLTVVTINGTILRYVTPCSLVDTDLQFGGELWLHFKTRNVIQANVQQALCWLRACSGEFTTLITETTCFSETTVSTRPRGVTSQKLVLLAPLLINGCVPRRWK
jgi:hypothetical protein